MTKIYVVRHGESEGNLFYRCHGIYDGHLTELGRRQAVAVANRLKDVPFTAAYSSNLARARDTALTILEQHPDIRLRVTTRLHEAGVGIWEDMNWGTIDAGWHQMLRNYHVDLDNWHVEGSESFKDVRARAGAFLRECAERHKGGTVLCTCHGYVIRAILCEAKNLPSLEIGKLKLAGNTAVSILNFDDDGNITVELESDCSHINASDSKGSLIRNTGREGRAIADKVRVVDFDLEKYGDLYKKWNPNGDIDKAKAAQKVHSRSVGMLLYDGEPSGMVELDTEKGKAFGKGWIEYYFVDEKKRGMGIAKALIGHALSVYRPLLRDFITIAVDADNESFCNHLEYYSFKKTESVTLNGKKKNILEYDLIV